jgi:hypothetical protein
MAIREDMNRLLVIHAHIRERRVPRTNVSGNQRKPALELGLAVTRHDDKRHALALKAIEGESLVRIGSEVRTEIFLPGRE